MDYGMFKEILWEDNEDYERVTQTKIEDQSRWSIYKSCVFRQISTGKYFEAYWGEGATESQDGQNEMWSFTEVEPHEVTIIEYKQKPNGEKFEGMSDD